MSDATPTQTRTNPLHAGIAAAEAGQMKAAAALLAKAVRVEPKDAEGWYWLARCLEESDRRVFCLRRALELNPTHSQARRLWRQLQTPTELLSPTPQASEIESVRVEPMRAAAATAMESSSMSPSLGAPRAAPTLPAASHPTPSTPVRSRGPRGLGRAGWIGLSLIGVACLVPVLALGVFGLRWALASHAPTAAPTRVLALATQSAPTPTLTATATEAPATLTPEPTPSLVLVATSAEIEALRLQARELIFKDDPEGAIAVWDELLAQAPHDADAHYRRAQAYLALTNGEHYLDRFVMNLTRAIEDLNQAIALGPIQGDYYQLREDTLMRLANVQMTNANANVYVAAALDDLRRAVALGTGETDAPVDESLYLAALGRCQEGLDLARQLEADPMGFPAPLIAFAKAKNEMCLGDLDAALTDIDAALQDGNDEGYSFVRSMVLFQVGRLDEARAGLDESIRRQPDYCGCRYFLRAAIELDQNQSDAGAADLETGYGQTWDHTGIFLYVQGRLALESGDTDTGWAFMQQALNSLDLRFSTLRQRILTDMQAAGVAPLPETPTVAFDPPAPAEAVVTVPLSAGRMAPLNPGRAVGLTAGYGPLIVYAGIWRSYHIQADTPLPEGPVVEASLRIENADESDSSHYEFWVWDQRGQTWGVFYPDTSGTAVLTDVANYVSPQGDLYILVLNTGDLDVRVGRIGATVGIQQVNGSVVQVGREP